MVRMIVCDNIKVWTCFIIFSYKKSFSFDNFRMLNTNLRSSLATQISLKLLQESCLYHESSLDLFDSSKLIFTSLVYFDLENINFVFPEPSRLMDSHFINLS